jgi:lipopolysaccharide/colanic/teichoic acid biosynthesis glycosyltransferase
MKNLRLQRLGKRALDVVVSSAGLVVLAPLLGGIAAVVRSRLGSPALFCQPRAGLHGQPFILFKFRTMREPRPGEDRYASDADRLTPFGRMLRSTSLDELPSLLNVLRGEMSLVGPRPLLLEYNDRYTPEQRRRLCVKPGLTGWAVVNGRNALSWAQKFELDVWYVDHFSLRLDLEILLRTLAQVVRRQGVSHGDHVTMPLFRGSQAEPAEPR